MEMNLFTIKQMEAVYWLHRLGSFNATSEKLHATQSTISKRVQEFERSFGAKIFERTNKGVYLTRLGHSLFPIVAQMMELHGQIAMLAGGNEDYAGTYRMGVSEIVALSWLPDLIAAIHAAYPRLSLEPQVDLSIPLIEQLDSHELDMVILPRMPALAGFTSEILGQIECAWLCSPQLLKETDETSLEVLQDYPFLMQSEGSAITEFLRSFFARMGIRGNRVLRSNSALALAEMAKAGIGVTYLPKEFFRPEIESGVLHKLDFQIEVPALTYVAAFHKNDDDTLSPRIASMAQSSFRASKAPVAPKVI